MSAPTRRLQFVLAFSSACSVANPDHCANLAGDTTCKLRDPDRPWCSLCIGDNDGCVGEQPIDSCHAVTIASTTSTATTAIDTTTTEPTTSGASHGDSLVATTTTTTTVTIDDTTTSNTSATTTTTDTSSSTTSGDPSTSSSSDTSSSTGGPACGNNVIEGDEICDRTNTNGQTCAKLLPAKWGGGKLKCTNTCESFDDTDCCIGVGQTCDYLILPDELCCGGLDCQLGTCKVK